MNEKKSYSIFKYKSLLHHICRVEPGNVPEWVLSTDCDNYYFLLIIPDALSLGLLMHSLMASIINFSFTPVILTIGSFLYLCIRMPFEITEERARRRIRRGMSVYPEKEIKGSGDPV